MSVIFLSGVHGVGKGFLGAPAARALGMDHLTASQLIREEKGRVTWETDKRVSEVDDNRDLLSTFAKMAGFLSVLYFPSCRRWSMMIQVMAI